MPEHAETTSSTGDGAPIAVGLPALSAAFLVKFDERKGDRLATVGTIPYQANGRLYTDRACATTVDVEGVVEFKSMPSGLHNVREDLVYFVHDDYAGISAVLNVEDEAAARKARVIAVGVLVSIEYGRMGKSWLLAESLKDLANKQIKKDDDYSRLDEFWNSRKLSESPVSEEGPVVETKKSELSIDTNVRPNTAGYRMNRFMSTGIGTISSSYTLPAHHPALALPEFLHLFGPLVFPLVRAALLRKRILFLGEAPVEQTCNFVYNLSILSALPRPIATILPDFDPKYLRLRPLFNVGVSDIPFLESESETAKGWIACTTDDVICTKPHLFDILIILPSATAQSGNLRPYPKIYSSSPELSKARPKNGIRASQRDAKRFVTLSKGLASIQRASRKSDEDAREAPGESAVSSSSEVSPESRKVIDASDNMSIISTASSTISVKSIIEPQSWSRIAYTSLVWWASAGDKRGGLSELEENEHEQDLALLTGEDLGEELNMEDEQAITREIACVQYFHRWTNLIFTAIGDATRRNSDPEQQYIDQGLEGQNVDGHQEDLNDDEERPLVSEHTNNTNDASVEKVEVTQDDIQTMGLDVWSQSDRQFVKDMVQFWWKREAEVQGGRIDCCGVRIL